MNDARTQLDEEAATGEQVIAELERTMKAEMTELRLLLDKQERQAARIDARGLPVIGFGILLSGVPDELASIPYPAGWLLPLLGSTLAVTAIVLSWRDRHTKR